VCLCVAWANVAWVNVTWVSAATAMNCTNAKLASQYLTALPPELLAAFMR
jgi:hypothetical protein